jgi:hypothetical protein
MFVFTSVKPRIPEVVVADPMIGVDHRVEVAGSQEALQSPHRRLHGVLKNAERET